MSSTLSNIQLGTSVATLDGLSVINADQLFVNGQNVNPAAPNIPTNPTSTNSLYAILFTNSFGAQPSAPLLVDGTFGLGYNPSTDMLYTQNLYTNGSIYLGGVSTGTPSYYIGVNSSNNIVKFSAPTVPVPTQIHVIGNTGYTQLFPAFLTTNATGDQYIFVDTAAGTLYYNEVSQTLVVQNLSSITLTTSGLLTANTLKINSVPAGTIAYNLAVDSLGNVIQGNNGTQLLTTRTGLSTDYYPTFVSSNTTDYKSYYVPYPQSGGYNILYRTTGIAGDIGTLYIPQLINDVSATFNSTVVMTGIGIGVPSYAVGLNSSNQIVKFTAGSPQVSTTSSNVNYYPVFVATVGTSIKDLYQDSIGGNFNYNPSTNVLSVENLTVSGTTTISGYATLASPAFTGTPTAPTAGSGTNTTQIATTAFVQSAIGGYLPLTGGTLTGPLIINNSGTTYARIGSGGFNTLYSETYFYDLSSHAIMQVSYSSGVNQNIASTASYNWQTTSGSSGTTCLNLSSSQAAFRMGSMFDFSVAGTWDNSNSLFITTGGNGSTNSGIGIGFNTTLNSGLLVSVAPNVAWRRMSYKAADHYFYAGGNTLMAGVNTSGIFANNAGYMTNSDGASVLGLTGYTSGDLIFYANSSRTTRFYTSSIAIQGTPSVYFGSGVNWFSGAYQLGYWDQYGASVGDWRISATAGLTLQGATGVNMNVGQQTYVSNQVLCGGAGNKAEWGVLYSTFYYGFNVNWKAGTQVAYFYKASATSILRVSGTASYYVSSSGMYTTQILWYNVSTGATYSLYNYNYTNNPNNHVSFPIMVQYSGLPVGTYAVYMYTNGITDGNDCLYILSEIVPS